MPDRKKSVDPSPAINISAPLELSKLKGVGPKTLAALNQLGIESVTQLLFHLPRKYEDHTSTTPINQVKANQRVIVEGVISKIKSSPGSKKRLNCILHDKSSSITAVFFQAPYLKYHLVPGKVVRCLGQVQSFRGQLKIIHPKLLNTNTQTESLTPIYPLSGGLTQTKLHSLISELLNTHSINALFSHELPDEWLKALELPTLRRALHLLHSPPVASKNSSALAKAQQRLTLDSLMAQCIVIHQKRTLSQKQSSLPIALSTQAHQQFKSCLAFELTHGQNECLECIAHAMQQTHPMLKLLQGDVGSGKTVIAAAAAFIAAKNGYQCAIMAPTELLANQLHQQIRQWLSPLGFQVALLTGRIKNTERKKLLQALSIGEISILVGTHALIQPDVEFSQLAVCIIDEQHRFGVEQRLSLHNKGFAPHVLLMSATPIPRTLAMTLYGELGVVELKVRPKGRQPITTSVLCDNKRDQLIEQLHEKCLQGEQIFWVCPRIEASDDLEEDDETLDQGNAMQNQTSQPYALAAQTLYDTLCEQLPDLNIGLIHGKMPDDEKALVMEGFRNATYHILVATTVIEVGIDVPNANIIVIESAQRFGLSQLHQLRGRVGRGDKPGYCLLLYNAPLSQQGKTRLDILRNHNDGFEIAQQDMLLRGPGEWLGTAQSGAPNQLDQDPETLSQLMNSAQQWAQSLCDSNPDFAEIIKKRWFNKQLRYAKG